jgi:hypothetical protein
MTGSEKHIALIFGILVAVLGVGTVIIWFFSSPSAPQLPSQTKVPIAETAAPIETPTNSSYFSTATPTPTEPEYVQVPNFVGFKKTAVMADAEARRALTISYTEEYSNDVEPGIVIRQSLNSGETVLKSTDLMVYVSAGPKPIPIIDFTGYPVEDAKKILEDEGLVVKTETVLNDGSGIENHIRNMTPAGGSTLFEGDEVVFYIYSAAPPSTTAPNINNSVENRGIIRDILNYLFG